MSRIRIAGLVAINIYSAATGLRVFRMAPPGGEERRACGAVPLVESQTQTAADFTTSGSGSAVVPHCTYITTCSRDFFTVIGR